MTIHPAPPEFRLAELSLMARDTVAETRSLYSGRETRLDFGGQWWECQAQTAALTRDQAGALSAWAAQLRRADALARFAVDHIAPRRGTTTAATVSASAAAAGAEVLTVSGLGAGKTLLAGSLLSDPEGRLFSLRADVTADGAGSAALALFPRLRQPVSAAATFRLTGVLSLWRLQEAPPLSFSVSLGRGAAGQNAGPMVWRFVEAFN